MINCNCFNFADQQIKWYSPDEKEIPFNYAEPEDLPHVILEKGTLVIPVFNELYQGTYSCGVENDSMLAANISLTVWNGVCLCV